MKKIIELDQYETFQPYVAEVKPLTPSQATAALGNAKATLETIDGTEVLGTSTAILLPAVELQEGETLTLNVDATIVKNDVETVE